MLFTNTECRVRDKEGNTVVAGKRTPENLYVIDESNTHSCLLSKDEENDLWHRRLGHLCQKNMRKLVRCKAIRDLPDIKRDDDRVCSACQKGKKAIDSYKSKVYTTTEPLQIVHTDLCGPMRNK